MVAQGTSTPVVVARGLTAGYHGRHAVAGLDLDVHRGEIFALAGPNGVGKTTVLRVLSNQIAPALGSIRVLGLHPGDDAVELRRRTGVLIDDLEPMGLLSARDVLWLCASVRDCDVEYAEKLADRLGIGLDRPIDEMSAGCRRALGIVQALMHEPELVVLDEPMAALDLSVQHELRAMLREVTVRGGTVVVTAHELDEVAAFADRALVLHSDRPATVVTFHADLSRLVCTG